MKRVIAHWTAGTYTPNGLDRKHYHYLIDGDSNVHTGNFPVDANRLPKKGEYAAHTLNCNTGSIGIAMCGMGGASENPLVYGNYPIKEAQFERMCSVIADMCYVHSLPVTPKTVLTHAEVERNLGIKQRGKWDIAVLPFKPELKGATAVGDYMRTRVHMQLTQLQNMTAPPAPPATDDPKPEQPLTLWQSIKRLLRTER